MFCHLFGKDSQGLDDREMIVCVCVCVMRKCVCPHVHACVCVSAPVWSRVLVCVCAYVGMLDERSSLAFEGIPFTTTSTAGFTFSEVRASRVNVHPASASFLPGHCTKVGSRKGSREQGRRHCCASCGLGRPSPYQSAGCRSCLCRQFQLPAHAHPGRQQVPARGEVRWSPGHLGLAWPRLLWASGQ